MRLMRALRLGHMRGLAGKGNYGRRKEAEGTQATRPAKDEDAGGEWRAAVSTIKS
jgi:hypothetical protein